MKNLITTLLHVICFTIAFMQKLLLQLFDGFTLSKIKKDYLICKILFIILFSTVTSNVTAQSSGPYSFYESFRVSTARPNMVATDGWYFSHVKVTLNSGSTLARTGSYFLTLGNSAGYNVITPSLKSPNEFKFYYRSSSATNNVTFKVEWSTNNFSTAPLGSVTEVVTMGATYQPFTINTSDFGIYANLKFKITITATQGAASLYVDDMSSTSRVGSDNNLIVPELGSLTSYQTVPVPGGNAPASPPNFTFYDQGGLYDIYNKNQTQTNYFAPTNSFDKVKITFNSFAAGASSSISVYNWDGVVATPLLANFAGVFYTNLPNPVSYTTLNPGNSLKVVYTSGTTQPNSGTTGYDCTVESVTYMTISGLSASSGCVGTPFTINGLGLSNASAVTIDGVAATINSNSATQIVVTPTAGSGGTGIIRVTAPAGIYTYSSYTVNPLPSIATSSSVPIICYSTDSQTASLPYTVTADNPVTYNITWNSLPTNNFTAVTDATLPSSAITLNVPASTNLGTYTGNLTVKNNLGCQNTPIPFYVVVKPIRTPTFTPVAPISSGDVLQELPTSSLEEITGLWSPHFNNTTTTTYTFTPDSGQCATNATMTIVVSPTIDQINPLTPGGKLEPIFDRFGNKYTLDKIRIAPTPSIVNKSVMLSSNLLCSSGIFDLYFEAGSGLENVLDPVQNQLNAQRRAVVCQVFSDLSNFINSPLHNAGNTTRVKIWIRDITQIPNVNPATLGLATGFYNVPYSPNAITGGIVDNEVWKTIHAGVDSYTNVANPIISNSGINFSAGLFYHGMMAINPNANWNTDLSIDSPTTLTDLYSVILHEVTHALGFASLIDFDGNSKFGLSYRYYSRYDTFLNYSATNLISPSSSGCSMYDYNFNVNPSNLHPGCELTPPANTGTPLDHTDCTTAINFVGTDTVPVYTSSCFETASSLSHFEDECYINPAGINYGNNNYFVMSNANAPGATKRYLKPDERTAL